MISRRSPSVATPRHDAGPRDQRDPGTPRPRSTPFRRAARPRRRRSCRGVSTREAAADALRPAVGRIRRERAARHPGPHRRPRPERGNVRVFNLIDLDPLVRAS